MDFVTGLPKTPARYDAMWIIVNRLTKSTHFLSIRANCPLEKLAHLYIQEIVKLHKVPSTIILDWDPRFASQFWGAFQKAFDIKLYLSTTYHPQTDDKQKELSKPWKLCWGHVWWSNEEAKVSICHWLSLPIIIATTPALAWLRMKLYMEGSDNLLCVGMNHEKWVF